MSNEELEKHAKEYILSQYGIEKGENENRMISLFMEGYLFHKHQVENLSLGNVIKMSYCKCENRSDNWYDDDGNHCMDCKKSIKQ